MHLFLYFSVICLDFSNALSHHYTVAWVTRPERLKGVKDVIKQTRRAATLKSGPGGRRDPKTSILYIVLSKMILFRE